MFALLGGRFDGNFAHFGFVLMVQIAVVSRNVDIYFAACFENCRREFFGFIVSFSSPCDIVGVTKGVDIQNVDVGGCKEEVLDEGCEHVPWIEE